MRQQSFASPEEAVAFFAAERARAKPESPEDFVLEHYGVKGMKWGVRKEAEGAGANEKVGDPVTIATGVVYAAVLFAPLLLPAKDIVQDVIRDARSEKKNAAWKKKPELGKPAPPMDIDGIQKSVVKQVNPNFGRAGTKMNCRRCTMAYEMRRRGYDVKATKTNTANQQEANGLKRLTPNKNHESVWGEKQISTTSALTFASPEKRSADIFAALAKHPDGARGEVTVGWHMGGGHSMAWEMIRGKPIIFDAQTGDVFRSPAAFTKHAHMVADAAYTRTDTLKMDEAFLRRWVSNV